MRHFLPWVALKMVWTAYILNYCASAFQASLPLLLLVLCRRLAGSGLGQFVMVAVSSTQAGV